MNQIEKRLLNLRRQYSSNISFLEKQEVYAQIQQLEKQVAPTVAKAIAQQVAQEYDVPAEQLKLL